MSNSRVNFVRLAEMRTKRTLRDLRLLGNLSNRSNYSFTEEDVQKIFSAVEAEARSAKRRFSDNLSSDLESDFKLDE